MEDGATEDLREGSRQRLSREARPRRVSQRRDRWAATTARDASRAQQTLAERAEFSRFAGDFPWTRSGACHSGEWFPKAWKAQAQSVGNTRSGARSQPKQQSTHMPRATACGHPHQRLQDVEGLVRGVSIPRCAADLKQRVRNKSTQKQPAQHRKNAPTFLSQSNLRARTQSGRKSRWLQTVEPRRRSSLRVDCPASR